MIITLPWPDKRLNPNARLHWRKLGEAKSKARWDAAFLAYEAMKGQAQVYREGLPVDGPIALTVSFYPPDKRHRDDDNMISSFKAARDGIADALCVNDRRFRPHYYFCEPEKPGRITVELFTHLCTDHGTPLGGPGIQCLVDGDRPNSEAVN